jgi:hypothetical protein
MFNQQQTVLPLPLSLPATLYQHPAFQRGLESGRAFYREFEAELHPSVTDETLLDLFESELSRYTYEREGELTTAPVLSCIERLGFVVSWVDEALVQAAH